MNNFMTIEELNQEKKELLIKVGELVKIKKELYSNIDIESPMSSNEKELNKEIADIFSRINQIVSLKNKLKNNS